MRDLLPPEMRAFRRVEDAFRAAAQRWGYGEVRTPTLEGYGLLTEAGALTPEMLSRVYSFLDWDGWSGERVVLRPDSTVPVARAVAENALALPARLFYVQSSFRFSATGADSETWQCGLEYIGAGQLLADIEVAAIGFEVLDSVVPGSALYLSHAGFARGVVELLESAGISVPSEIGDAITAHGLQALADITKSVPAASTIVELAGRPSADVALLANIAAVAGDTSRRLTAAIEESATIAAALQASGRAVILDVGLSPDFGYYTGPIFEFRRDGRLWGRGGRYELAPSLGGHSATGLGLDATALASAVPADGTLSSIVAVVPARPNDFGRAIEVARTLHRNDIPAALLAAPAESSAMTVVVRDGVMEAHTPEGVVQIETLDRLLPLLFQFK
jgi:histidyl-tRNA synthetase